MGGKYRGKYRGVNPPVKHKYRDKSKVKDNYEDICASLVPEGLTWKPSRGRSHTVVVMYSLGNIYKLVRTLATGAVVYYKLKDTGPEKSPAEQIDAEPQKKGQVRYRVGKQCWFIDTGERWFLCTVVARTQHPDRIIIRPVTGTDATREVAWPYGSPDDIRAGGDLEFPAKDNNPLFLRLRPLSARQP